MTIEFGILNENGIYTKTKTLQADAICNCSHYIFDPLHYYEDGSCRCNDKNHKEMIAWGYEWKKDKWVS